MPQDIEDTKDNTVELIMRASIEYSVSLNSIRDHMPVEVIHASSDEIKVAIKAKMVKVQQTNINKFNILRQKIVFKVVEKVNNTSRDGQEYGFPGNST